MVVAAIIILRLLKRYESSKNVCIRVKNFLTVHVVFLIMCTLNMDALFEGFIYSTPEARKYTFNA